MDPAAAVSLITNGSPWGLLAVALFVIKSLYDRNQKLQDARLEDKDQRLEDTKQAMAAVTGAVDTVKATINALQTLSRQ